MGHDPKQTNKLTLTLRLGFKHSALPYTSDDEKNGYIARDQLLYCIKGNVNVCLMFPNLPNGFGTGTIKTLSLITFVGMLGQAMFVFRLSNSAVYLSNSLAQQMATYVI